MTPVRSGKKPKRIAGFLLDENVPETTADFLKGRGYRVQRPERETPDYQVFQLSRRGNMVLVTQDSRMRRHVSGYRHPGVVIVHSKPDRVSALLDEVLSLFNPIEELRALVVEISNAKISITDPRGIRLETP